MGITKLVVEQHTDYSRLDLMFLQNVSQEEMKSHLCYINVVNLPFTFYEVLLYCD